MSSLAVRQACAAISSARQQDAAIGPQQDAARIGSGDDDSERFTRLVMPHLNDAYSLARWITGNGSDAEDVVQDACLRALRAISQVAEGTARPWLLTIVRNTAYVWLRRNRPSAVLLADDLQGAEAAQAIAADANCELPEARLIAKDDAARLSAAIAALPISYRETIILREVQELSYREIAEMTEVPIGTVMSRLARARRRLIAIMAENAEQRN